MIEICSEAVVGYMRIGRRILFGTQINMSYTPIDVCHLLEKCMTKYIQQFKADLRPAIDLPDIAFISY